MWHWQVEWRSAEDWSGVPDGWPGCRGAACCLLPHGKLHVRHHPSGRHQADPHPQPLWCKYKTATTNLFLVLSWLIADWWLMDRGWCRETYTSGTQFVLINISYLLSTPIAAYVFLPVFCRLQSALFQDQGHKIFNLATASLEFIYLRVINATYHISYQKSIN